LAQNVHFHGDNIRFNAGGTYNSTNVVSVSKEQLFVHLRAKARLITDVAERNEIVTRLDKLQKAQGSGWFLPRVSC
jgi:tRNA(Phe) wybutosine-synthesizing methylase Tyw3